MRRIVPAFAGLRRDMPEDIDWNRLSAEITANIRVGLAAGECVAPRSRKPGALHWRPAAVVAGIVVVLAGGWWLNTPPAQTQELGHAMRAVWDARGGAGIRRWRQKSAERWSKRHPRESRCGRMAARSVFLRALRGPWPSR